MLNKCYELIENVFNGEKSLSDCIYGKPETFNEHLLIECLKWYEYKVKNCGNPDYYEQLARCIIKYFINSYLNKRSCFYVHNYIFRGEKGYPPAIYVWRVYRCILKRIPKHATVKKTIYFSYPFNLFTYKNRRGLLYERNAFIFINEDCQTSLYITKKIENKIINKKFNDKKSEDYYTNYTDYYTKEDITRVNEQWQKQVIKLEEILDKKEKEIKELNEKIKEMKEINERNKILDDKRSEIKNRINKILQLINN